MTDHPLFVIDRKTQLPIEEKVWGDSLISLLYGNSIIANTLGRFLLHTFFRHPLVSSCIGAYYDTSSSKKLIKGFCQKFSINTQEATLPLFEYKSFNDFFTRHLRPECRIIDQDPCSLIAPADGRYRFFSRLSADGTIDVKGSLFNLDLLVDDPKLASLYYGGSAILCRLCPADCHRFYFPCDGIAGEPRMIHGPLFSVNPRATNRYPWIFWTNRRVVTPIQTTLFGKITYIEVGATNCGSIVQEFKANSLVQKGQEKGFFKLGGSAIILLFEKNAFKICDDLFSLSSKGQEVLCHIGEKLGTSRE